MNINSLGEGEELGNFSSIEEIMKANDDLGKHFFSPGATRFFKSRVLEEVYAGCLFVTSEKGPNNIRKYTVRCALANGSIEKLSAFQQFETSAGAKRWAASLVKTVTELRDKLQKGEHGVI